MKNIVILLLLIYSGSTFGVTVHLHYCMNELIGWTLWYHGDKENAVSAGWLEKSGCCKDEHKSFKVKRSIKSVMWQNWYSLLSPVIAIPAYNYSDNISYRPLAISYPVSHALHWKERRCLSNNCVFLIWFYSLFCQHQSVPGYLHFPILYLKFYYDEIIIDDGVCNAVQCSIIRTN